MFKEKIVLFLACPTVQAALVDNNLITTKERDVKPNLIFSQTQLNGILLAFMENVAVVFSARGDGGKASRGQPGVFR
ncbi:hypothetical protein E2C01_034889 [Portunus trituberculatus]|uniref:Uncharacterized protein n=1 Tax=Portunus trituberculatus TaxID=210409 RepID=A0A5B7F2Q8_PORTR|nr:hypothetical protein [Portunus trituberculatus]